MHVHAPSIFPREALAGLRHHIRVPLHEIISYAEIITEDAGQEQDPPLFACLSKIISNCELVLRLTTAFRPEDGHEKEFIEDLSRHLQEGYEKFLPLTEQLQSLTGLERYVSLRADVTKLINATHNFRQTIVAIGENNHSSFVLPGPFLTASGPAPDRTSTDASSEAGPTLRANRPLLLVVDDNEENRDLLSRRLLRDGCEVMLAESGRQALRMAQRYSFDLILLDIMMPEMDGFTVLMELKKNPRFRHLPVIMISAIDEVESIVRCIEMGADDYLPKPFNRVLLRAKINALLERKRLQDEETRQKRELERAFSEIENQRKQTENLLLNILPSSIAEELRSHGSVQPIYFEDVTIVFADFVGFTLSTEQLSADELVHTLHQYFSEFDDIMTRYGLEKLKTIGDCYMFAGGLPQRYPSHPVDAVLAALEMIDKVQEMGRTGPVNWQLRVGAHTGPVVAGVVGIHKFSFDIWGDAVNFASRMESSGSPGHVNLSSHTYSRVKDFFACEKRGRVKTKDGNEVEMYFVSGIASRLSASKNVSAAKAFQQRYQTYFRRELQSFPKPLCDETG